MRVLASDAAVGGNVATPTDVELREASATVLALFSLWRNSPTRRLWLRLQLLLRLHPGLHRLSPPLLLLHLHLRLLRGLRLGLRLLLWLHLLRQRIERMQRPLCMRLKILRRR